MGIQRRKSRMRYRVQRPKSSLQQKKPKKTKLQRLWQSFTHSFWTFFVFALTALGIWILLLMLKNFIGFDFWVWFKGLPIIYPIASYIAEQIARRTFEGIVYAFTFSSLFFIPTPLELLFVGFLSTVRGNMAVIVPAFIGLIVGQHINYWCGKVFGRLIKGYIKRKTRHKIQDRLQKYGATTIFFINLFPLPYPITNFLAGSLKYPYKKWALFASLALAIKLVFIAWLVAILF